MVYWYIIAMNLNRLIVTKKLLQNAPSMQITSMTKLQTGLPIMQSEGSPSDTLEEVILHTKIHYSETYQYKTML